MKKELGFCDASKEELFPGSRRYLSSTRFKSFQKHMHKSPVNDAVHLAVLIFGCRDTMMKIFNGDHHGLTTVLGEDVVNDLIGKARTLSVLVFKVNLS